MTPHSVESVLADFRAWLSQALAAAGSGGLDGDQIAPLAPEEAPVDLHTLLGQFLALRHEVNLQTRAVRSQQEQNAETLKQLTQALQVLRQSQGGAEERPGRSPRSDEELLRPLLKTLLDLHDALTPAEREAGRVAQTILPGLDAYKSGQPEKSPVRRSWFRRLFGRREPSDVGRPSSAADPQLQPALERIRQLLGSLLTGYTMSVQRVERSLQQHGLEPIPTVGRSFDPELMEVVEVVTDSDRPAGEVIEEVRRGYLWHGRVFRYAQVRVAKP
jgi:molecular chaperone GrpE